MIPLEDCFKYEPDFPKLTKSNSFIHEGRVVVVLSKDHEGKDLKYKEEGKYKTAYNAYDYKTRIQLVYNKTKDGLINYIKRQSLGVLND